MSMLRKLSVAALCLSALPLLAAEPYVPDELDGWRAWVLDGRDYRDCPFYFNRGATERNDFLCAWPETLNLEVDDDGGEFSQQWTVDAEDAWLPLPGTAEHWPDRVLANGAAVAVVERDGRPQVRVAPGRYRLSGRFEWDERPGVLVVPPQSGLVALTVNGRAVARPEILPNGVFLGERERESEQRDAVSVQVYRLVSDDIPTRLVTRLQIDVSGSVREELFAAVLPDNFVPLSLYSPLPVRLESDGQLRVQVRPGRWEVMLAARAESALNALTLPQAQTRLPDSEIWSYQRNDRLRVTAAEGLPPVDPARVQVPDGWDELPAFRITRGETLTIVERSRGQAAVDNELTLAREMWLDFDGGGFVVEDLVGGTMREGWRLDMRAPYVLGSATEGGENLLITLGEDDGSTGIELRERDLDVSAIGRNDSRGAMPVTGWAARFGDVGTTLYLPPGHKLFAAPGVDAARGSWVGQWQLLDFFLVLIITIAAWKLFGRTPGIIALFALTLSFHEINAPSWLWLNLLIAIALLRVAPDGWLRHLVRSYFGISALLLVLTLVPFIAGQLRVAIYPQLESQMGPLYPAAVAPDFDRPPAPAVEAEAPARPREAQALRKSEVLDEIVVTGARVSQSANFARYAPNAVVQAGPGIPSWQWNAYRLQWDGPVDADQAMRLVILPRWSVSLLRIVEVLLLLAFAAVLAAEVMQRRVTLPGGLTIGRSAAVLLAGAALLATADETRAELPSPELLDELQRRLLEPPDCVPRCAEINEARIEVDAGSVRIRLTIDALEAVAVPMPGSARGWQPDAVAVDGAANAQIIRAPNQELWLRVSQGRHTVDLRGSAAGADNIEIPFPTPPRVVSVQADGWFVAGIKDRRLLAGSLQLTRLQSGDDGTPRWESSRFPAFVHVTRTIELGLDWRVTTTVERVAPQQGALTLELPLIDGETIVTDNMSVRDSAVLVSMNPTQRVVSWQSNLPRTSPLELTSAPGMPWKEIWRIGVGSVWHAEFSGVPESASDEGESVRVAEFHPRSGETLTIVATRPQAAPGTTLAFDAIRLEVMQGARSRESLLMLSYRSTRGAQHVISLPADADVTSVSIDGRSEPLRADGGQLTVPIVPGEHTIVVDWREDVGVGWRTRTPPVDIGAPSSNIRLLMGLPDSRWLLATSGPALGPAVLYWSELALMVLLALILGRIDWTPLRTRHWLLLGLGFSTFNWPALAFVVAWLLVVGARDRWRKAESWWSYNLVQLGMIAITVVALGVIVTALPMGLLGTPDMHVAGNDSYGSFLSWFADRSESALPQATALSVPMWLYKGLILAWALWLSFALLKWLPWTWQCFARDGFFRSWRAKSGDTAQGSA